MLSKPPIKTAIIDQTGLNQQWATFFQKVASGDAGALWTPTWTSLTTVGSVTTAARYYYLSAWQVYASIQITSSGGGTSASTAGTTYIDNPPFTIARDSVIYAADSTTNIGIGTGIARATGNRIYTPTWVATTNTITITGILEV